MPILEDDTWDGCLMDLLPLGAGIILVSTVICGTFVYDILWTLTATVKGWKEWAGVAVAGVICFIQLFNICAAMASSSSLLSIAKPLHTLVILGILLSFAAQMVVCIVDREWVMPYIVIYSVLHGLSAVAGIWGRNIFASALTRLENDLMIWKRSDKTRGEQGRMKLRDEARRRSTVAPPPRITPIKAGAPEVDTAGKAASGGNVGARSGAVAIPINDGEAQKSEVAENDSVSAGEDSQESSEDQSVEEPEDVSVQSE